MKHKKLMSLLIAVAMTVTYCIGFCVPVSAGTTTVFSVSSTAGAPGETVEVTVSIANNPEEIGALFLAIKADEGLTLTAVNGSSDTDEGIPDSLIAGIMKKSIAMCSEDLEASPFTVSWEPSNIKKAMTCAGGVLVTLTYKIADDAKGDLKISAAPETAGNYCELGGNSESIPFTATPGTVSVVCKNHQLTKTAGTPATCTEAGTIDYWTCSVCDKMFSDAEGKTVITQDDLVAPALGHKMTKVDEVPATCKAAGTEAYWTCSVCEKMFSDEEGKTEIKAPEEIPIAAHTLVKTDEVPANCDKEGTEAYWTCSVCKKMFSDADGKTEITAPVVIEKTKHEVTFSEAEDPTCDKDGHIAYYTCKNCGKVYEDEDGKTQITDLTKVTIPALGHKLEKTEEVPADCKEKKDGTKAYWTCSECKKLFSDEEGKNEIEEPETIAWAHTWGDVIDYDSDDDKPTCEKAGKGMATCTVCGEKELITVSALGHDYSNWKVTKPATETEDGEETRVCANCGDKQTRTIPATGGKTEEKTDDSSTTPATFLYENVNYYIPAPVAAPDNKSDDTQEEEKTEEPVAEVADKDGKYTVLDVNESEDFDLDNIVINPAEDFEIRIAAPFEKFESLFIDDEEVDEDDYTVTKGSTIIELSAAFLQTLDEGDHNMKVKFKDGYVDLDFAVESADEEDTDDEDIDETDIEDVDEADTEDVSAETETETEPDETEDSDQATIDEAEDVSDTTEDAAGTPVVVSGEESNPATNVGMNVGMFAVIGLAAGAFVFMKKNRK